MHTTFWIGCSGYAYPEWKGRWYPPDLSRSQWFHYYARHFRTVEINATFYRLPPLTVIQRWKEQAPPDFYYVLKAPRKFTHHRQWHSPPPSIDDFLTVASHLHPHLAGFLFQFPRYQYPQQPLIQHLAQLRERTDAMIACEFRHPGWWIPEWTEWCEHHQLVFCSVIAPHFPSRFIVTNNQLYLRIHGDPWYRQNFSDTELRSLAQRLRQLHIQTGWIYFNNTVNAYAPHNAAYLQQLLEAASNHQDESDESRTIPDR